MDDFKHSESFQDREREDCDLWVQCAPSEVKHKAKFLIILALHLHYPVEHQPHPHIFFTLLTSLAMTLFEHSYWRFARTQTL